MIKPMLAVDWNESKVKFPVVAQPKIDGVRAMNLTGRLAGRSGKEHGNLFTSNFFSHELCYGLDGELAANAETHPDLCRMTTSAVSTIIGEPFVLWHVFDFVADGHLHENYTQRYERLVQRVNYIKDAFPEIGNRIRVVPGFLIRNMDDLIHQDTLWLAAGYEGTILRDPTGAYKQGRSTAIQGGLLRIKRFVQEDAVVLSVEEGEMNTNEATFSPHGYTERSTHKENMVPNGMVGTLHCRDCKTGQQIKVAAGRMTHHERKAYFDFPENIVGKTISYKKFLKGEKDKPRFPTFQMIKTPSDIGYN